MKFAGKSCHCGKIWVFLCEYGLDSCKGKITEHDLWAEMDCLRELKFDTRNLQHIMEDLLLHLRYRDL